MKRVLLDENLDRRLKNYFSSEFEVISVPDLGWQSKKNGDLLSSMDEAAISYLLTVDRNLRFQQNLKKYSVTIVLISTYDNRLRSIREFVPEIESAILDAESTERIIEIDVRKR